MSNGAGKHIIDLIYNLSRSTERIEIKGVHVITAHGAGFKVLAKGIKVIFASSVAHNLYGSEKIGEDAVVYARLRTKIKIRR